MVLLLLERPMGEAISGNSRPSDVRALVLLLLERTDRRVVELLGDRWRLGRARFELGSRLRRHVPVGKWWGVVMSTCMHEGRVFGGTYTGARSFFAA